MLSFRQQRIKSNFCGVLWDIFLMPDANYADVTEALINTMIPDGNYIEFNHTLYYSKRAQVYSEMRRSDDADADLVLRLLTKMRRYAADYDDAVFAHPGPHKYTAPLFDRIEEDTCKWFGSEGSSMTGDFREFLDDPKFDRLRERDGFIALYSQT